MELTIDELRYPIGKFKVPESYTAEYLAASIRVLEEFPASLRKAVQGLNDEQLDTPYREGGWTLRQVVHHVADSHLNAYIRCKLAVTEENPTVKVYEEQRWAELPEAKHAPVELSLPLVESLHKRWVVFLKNLSAEQLQMTFHHPVSKANVTLQRTIALYAWHCSHHLAHITGARKRMGW